MKVPFDSEIFIANGNVSDDFVLMDSVMGFGRHDQHGFLGSNEDISIAWHIAMENIVSVAKESGADGICNLKYNMYHNQTFDVAYYEILVTGNTVKRTNKLL